MLALVAKVKLFGLLNVHINHSGSYWDNHIFYLLAGLAWR